MRAKMLIGASVAVLGLLLPAVAAAAAGGGAAVDPNRATVTLADSPYGKIIVVGGAGAGYVAASASASASTPAHYLYPAGSSLYVATIDPPTYTQLPGQTP
jgi:hypothetical protein